MNKQFNDYLLAIGFTEPLLKRAEQVHDFYLNTLKFEIVDIFVSDYYDKEGARQYESLWFLNNKFWMEAKNFLISDSFDMAYVECRIQYWKIDKQEYDFIKANDKSRLSIQVGFSFELGSTFKAAKENCDFLRDLFMKYIAQMNKK